MSRPLPPAGGAWEEVARLAGHRARAWLTGLDHAPEASTTIRGLLQRLVGCWICETALLADARRADSGALAHAVRARLDRDEREAFSALLACDAALVLTVTGILRALDQESVALERFVQGLAASLAPTGPAGHDEEPDLFVTRFLLGRLGAHETRRGRDLTSLPLNQGAALFQAAEPAIRAIAAQVAEATAFGAEAPAAPAPGLAELAAVLPAWLLCYLRQYQLEMACLLLRTMSYLGLRGDRAFRASLDFIRAQQQLDGHFGFLAPELSHLRGPAGALDGPSRVYLPLTVSCLWAIAEGTTGFVLFRSF